MKVIQNKVKEIIEKKQLKTLPEIIAVTKTFPDNAFLPLLKMGHIHFGENKIQEAESKWSQLKKDFKNLKLHMLGKLQSNKAKKAIKLFDYIHSLDSEKLAIKLDKYQKELNKKVKFFIEINIAEESQKSGILLNNLNSFYNFCTKDLSLDVIGLMCLPPFDKDPDNYFKLLKKKSDELKLNDLSMGMSGDYEKAILLGSTYIRLGTAIFGERKN